MTNMARWEGRGGATKTRSKEEQEYREEKSESGTRKESVVGRMGQRNRGQQRLDAGVYTSTPRRRSVSPQSRKNRKEKKGTPLTISLPGPLSQSVPRILTHVLAFNCT